MTAYGDLFRLAFEAAAGAYSGRDVPELVAEVVLKQELLWGPGQPAGPGGASDPHPGEGAATRIGDALAYDVALAYLCDRLGIEHDLGGPHAGPRARDQAERSVSEHLPGLEGVFSSAGRASGGPLADRQR